MGPEAHAAWCAKWAPPCPDGNPQRLRRARAFRERNIGELELRVPLTFDEGGARQVILEESDDTVLVRVLVCLDPEADIVPPPREFVDCPVRVWLDRPLENRTVVDVDSNEALPLFAEDLTPRVTAVEPAAGLIPPRQTPKLPSRLRAGSAYVDQLTGTEAKAVADALARLVGSGNCAQIRTRAG